MEESTRHEHQVLAADTLFLLRSEGEETRAQLGSVPCRACQATTARLQIPEAAIAILIFMHLYPQLELRRRDIREMR